MNNLTPAQRGAQTRARRKVLTEDEVRMIYRIATCKEMWREEGDPEYRVKVAELYIAGCDIYMADFTMFRVKVNGHDVTNIAGPWYEKLREKLPDLLLAAEEYRNGAEDRAKEAELARKRQAKARRQQTKNAALRDWRG